MTVGGHGFDSGVSGQLADRELTSIRLPDADVAPLDVGFQFSALTPPGEHGFADLTVVNGDGQTATVANAFYYIECPGAPYVETARPHLDLTAGTTVNLRGCGFATGMVAEFTPPGDPSVSLGSAPLTLDCATAVATFVAPPMPDGNYGLIITDGAGTVLFGTNLCDSYDTAYYGYTCEDAVLLNWSQP